MRFGAICPLACPVASSGTPGISSRDAELWQVAPTTLLTCPSVGSCHGRCPSNRSHYLPGDLSISDSSQRGGFIVCPLASHRFVRGPSGPLPPSLNVPAKEGESLAGCRRDGRDGGAS